MGVQDLNRPHCVLHQIIVWRWPMHWDSYAVRGWKGKFGGLQMLYWAQCNLCAGASLISWGGCIQLVWEWKIWLGHTMDCTRTLFGGDWYIWICTWWGVKRSIILAFAVLLYVTIHIGRWGIVQNYWLFWSAFVPPLSLYAWNFILILGRLCSLVKTTRIRGKLANFAPFWHISDPVSFSILHFRTL
jgi:hypothetical protein